jgi:hypothetical protein
MINAVRKSWEKMTEAGRVEALKLSFGDREKQLIERALTPGSAIPAKPAQGD